MPEPRLVASAGEARYSLPRSRDNSALVEAIEPTGYRVSVEWPQTA